MDIPPSNKVAHDNQQQAQYTALRFVLDGYGAFSEVSWRGIVELVTNQANWIPRNAMASFVRRTAERVCPKISNPQLHSQAIEALALCRDASSTLDQRRKLATSIDSSVEFVSRHEPALCTEVSAIFCRATSCVLAPCEYEAARDISYHCLLGFSAGIKGVAAIRTAKEEEAYRQAKTLRELLTTI